MQAALAAEHAVIWGYAVVGAHLDPSLRPLALTADTAHRARRDATVALIRSRGGVPVATGVAYTLPFPVSDRAGALRLAVHLEEGDAAAWRYVIAAGADPPLRRAALTALTDAAVRATGWRQLVEPGAATVPFPGQ